MRRRRPQWRWWHLALIVVLAASSVAGCDIASQSTPSPTAAPTDRPNAAPTDEETPEPTTASATVPTAPEGETEDALVVRVVDGDTIEVEIDGEPYTVRYIGLDAPEIADEGGQDEPFAREAMAANRGLVADQTVLLERDDSDLDESGRLLRYVWVDVNGTLRLVNHILLARGFAELMTDSPDDRYAEAFQVAETAARDRGAGLWATGSSEPSATPEPSSASETIVTEDEVSIGAGQTAFRGEAGTYRWTTITFASSNDFAIRWSATSTSGACELAWSLSGANGSSGSAAPTEPGQANGRSLLPGPDPGSSELIVTSDCRKWLITFNEVKPRPTPAPTPEPTPAPTAGPTEDPSAEPST